MSLLPPSATPRRDAICRALLPRLLAGDEHQDIAPALEASSEESRVPSRAEDLVIQIGDQRDFPRSDNVDFGVCHFRFRSPGVAKFVCLSNAPCLAPVAVRDFDHRADFAWNESKV